ncbi:hypothetical protein RYX36_025617 [Vicia faba]
MPAAARVEIRHRHQQQLKLTKHTVQVLAEIQKEDEIQKTTMQQKQEQEEEKLSLSETHWKNDSKHRRPSIAAVAAGLHPSATTDHKITLENQTRIRYPSDRCTKPRTTAPMCVTSRAQPGNINTTARTSFYYPCKHALVSVYFHFLLDVD